MRTSSAWLWKVLLKRSKLGSDLILLFAPVLFVVSKSWFASLFSKYLPFKYHRIS